MFAWLRLRHGDVTVRQLLPFLGAFLRLEQADTLAESFAVGSDRNAQGGGQLSRDFVGEALGHNRISSGQVFLSRLLRRRGTTHSGRSVELHLGGDELSPIHVVRRGLRGLGTEPNKELGFSLGVDFLLAVFGGLSSHAGDVIESGHTDQPLIVGGEFHHELTVGEQGFESSQRDFQVRIAVEERRTPTGQVGTVEDVLDGFVQTRIARARFGLPSVLVEFLDTRRNLNFKVDIQAIDCLANHMVTFR